MPEGCQGYEAVTGWMNHGTWGMLGFRKVTRGGVHGFRRVNVCGVRGFRSDNRLTGVRPWAVGAGMEFCNVFGKGGKHVLWILLLTEWG